MANIAVIQIRGLIDAKQTVKDTVRMLNLNKKHACVVVEDTPSNMGMLRKAQDVITYGPVSDDVVKQLQTLMGDSPRANLHPPRKGFKSIKRAVGAGGDLGPRESMDDLIRRMLP